MDLLDAAMRAIYFDMQCGPSVAGKNTVAKLWQNYRVRSGVIRSSPTSGSAVSD